MGEDWEGLGGRGGYGSGLMGKWLSVADGAWEME